MKKRIFLISLVALVLLALPFAVCAEGPDSGKIGENITWTLDSSGVLTFSGTGCLSLSYSSSQNLKYYLDDRIKDVKSVIIQDGITGIGLAFFDGCSNMTEIVVPETVTSIYGSAFSECSSLTNIQIPSGVTEIDFNTFWNCSNLTNVTIPEGVTRIRSGAFYSCSALKSIIIPDGITTIEGHTFWNCSSLESVTIPDSIKTIEYDAFSGCTSLKSITLPDGVSTVANGAFKDCDAIKYASLDSKAAKALGKAGYSFRVPGEKFDLRYYFNSDGDVFGTEILSADKDITEITFPAYVDRIGREAFQDCTKLKKVTIPDHITNIGSYAFARSGLEAVTIPDNVTEFGECVFSGCQALTSAVLPDSFTSIPYGTMQDCSALTSFTIPSKVTDIYAYAFSGCSALSSLTIPESVTSIRYAAFTGCSGIESLTLPDHITKVENRDWGNPTDGSFDDCPAIRYAHAGSETAITLSNANYTFRIPGNECDLTQTSADKGPRVVSADPNSTEITIPAEVSEIFIDTSVRDYKNAFDQCTEVKNIIINTPIDIDFLHFFRNCGKLESITIVADHPSYSSRDGVVFSKDGKTLLYYPRGKKGAYTIPENVTSIGTEAFSNCLGLTEITVPAGITEIGYSAFKDSTALTHVQMNARMTEISFGSIFTGCTVLTGISIPEDHRAYSSKDGVVFDKEGTMLLYCPKGKSGMYNIPDGTIQIGQSAFLDCQKLTGVTIPDSVKMIGTTFFGSWDSGSFRNCAGLTSIRIPDSVTSVAVNAFRDCTGLTEIEVPCYVWNDAFNGCTGLKKATINGSVESKAFYGCTSLTDVEILKKGTHIYSDAFSECPSLKTVTLHEKINEISKDSISKTAKIIAPEGSYAAKWAYDNYYDLETYHAHTLTWHEAVEASASGDGTEEYWSCEGCGKLFADADGEEEITEPVVILKLIKGDINDDGEVDGRDAIHLMKWLAEEDEIEIAEKNADLNEDGIVDERDLLKLLQYLAGVA
ncbi:MAG: leucine-rich repeat protein [Clostridia bacterium]|nr:leucine-rich repeat protein [Clostridia bacterium]